MVKSEIPNQYTADEIRRADEIVGKTSSHNSTLFQWLSCPICYQYRWVQLNKKKPTSLKCRRCSPPPPNTGQIGNKSAGWKGGRIKTEDGYVAILLLRDDPFFAMCNSQRKYTGYVREHRLVMAKHLGRCLGRDEIIHHKNGIRDDNRLENLEITSIGAHISDHSKGYKSGYEAGWEDAKLAWLKQSQDIRVKLVRG